MQRAPPHRMCAVQRGNARTRTTSTCAALTREHFCRDHCGVGILFATNIEGALAVADVVKSGPADRSGLIKRGE